MLYSGVLFVQVFCNEPDGDLHWSVVVSSGNLALTRMSLMYNAGKAENHQHIEIKWEGTGKE